MKKNIVYIVAFTVVVAWVIWGVAWEYDKYSLLKKATEKECPCICD